MKKSSTQEAEIRYIPATIGFYQRGASAVYESLSALDQELEILLGEENLAEEQPPPSKPYLYQLMRKLRLLTFLFTLSACLTTPLWGQEDRLPDTRAAAMLRESYEILKQGQINQAMELMDSAIVIGKAEEDYVSLGCIYDAKGETLAMMFRPGVQYNFEQSLHYFTMAKDSANIFGHLRSLGELQQEKGNVDSAFLYFELAGEYDETASTSGAQYKNLHYLSIGDLLSSLGRTDEAIEAYLKALDGPRTDTYLSAIYSHLSYEHIQLGDYERADYYADLYHQLTEGKPSRALGNCLRNKAIVAYKQGQYEKATALAEEAIGIFQASGNEQNFVPGVKTTLFSIHFAESDYSAAGNILASLQEEDFRPQSPDYGQFFLQKMQWALHTNDLNEVPAYLEKGMVYTLNTNDLYIKQLLYEYGAEYYERTRNANQEIAYLRASQVLRDSLYDVRRTQYANLLDTRYETEQKEQMIAQMQLEDELQSAELQSQRSIITGGLVGLAMLAGFLLLLFRRNRQIAEQKGVIQKALQEKDTLLREIHHRVKNNLQLVSSLLGLQGLTTKDQEIKEAINAGKSRVMSMALIHQDLYNKEQLTSVNVREYLEKLCQELISTYQISPNQVSFQADIEPLDLDVDTLIPLGLIINELLTNALKYAFPKGASGQIHIKLHEVNNLLRLEVNDDGVGFDPASASSSSFGFRLINSLLRQLDGEMESSNQDGAQFRFQFRDYKKRVA
ncbi:MAG: histidine kinase dimerization/phosphoacceptor domain -containing protein [Bacteroidota bacterium]